VKGELKGSTRGSKDGGEGGGRRGERGQLPLICVKSLAVQSENCPVKKKDRTEGCKDHLSHPSVHPERKENKEEERTEGEDCGIFDLGGGAEK